MNRPKKATWEITRNYKTIKKLIEQHGKVRIVFARAQWDYENEKFIFDDADCGFDLRRRIITKDGSCKVAYKSPSYKKFSGYGTSCFVSGLDLKDFKNTLLLMRQHDGIWIKPIEVHYGWFFRKKVIL